MLRIGVDALRGVNVRLPRRNGPAQLHSGCVHVVGLVEDQRACGQRDPQRAQEERRRKNDEERLDRADGHGRRPDLHSRARCPRPDPTRWGHDRGDDSDDHEIPGKDEPRHAHVHVDIVEVARREPEGRQDHRGHEPDPRDEPAPAADQRHERQQPDHVLGREHLPERDVRTDGRDRCGDEPAVVQGSPRKPGPDGDERSHGRDGRDEEQEVGSRARDVLGSERRDDRDSQPDQAVRHDQDRAAEALDLERTIDLPLQGSPDALGRDERERQDADDHDGDEDPETDQGLAPSAPSPHLDDQDRQDHCRIDLGHRGEGEAHGTDPMVAVDHRRKSARGERGRPEVEMRCDHRPDEDR